MWVCLSVRVWVRARVCILYALVCVRVCVTLPCLQLLPGWLVPDVVGCCSGNTAAERDTARQGAELAELLAQYSVLVFEGAASASAGRKLRYRVGCVIIHAGFHQSCHVTRHDEQPSLVLKSNQLTVRALVRHVCD